ncbi:hypothetical protein FPOAC2_14480 [Fusarium poae]|uniref:PD-(D/E)XK nuclease-like domain-containing protein n=1 Tax=Fusarium poae TaxID=36050 RepID=A0A1B8A512_FUSPO|nr:uncharacterized protein FPOAC1_013205 [Fusarium poae]KAG8665226.1 hypothetical protein FPOAC1_013205 [Fusarium poae]OBS15555.1 hypothetical protein FPOA_13628 [Fusarium poae]
MDSVLELRIDQWLASVDIPAQNHSADQPPLKKRKRYHQNNQLLSPEQSTKNSNLYERASAIPAPYMAPETPGKRKADDNNDVTPRAPQLARSQSSIFEGVPDFSSRSGTGTSTSKGSGRSSPIKQTFPVVGLGGHVLHSRTLNPSAVDMPDELYKLYVDIQKINMGQKFLPQSWEAGINERSKTIDRTLQMLEPSVAYILPPTTGFTVDDDDEMPLSSVFAIVDDIIEEAQRCQNDPFDETGWNHLVHTPLIKAVIKQKCWPGSSILKMSPCMTASVTARYHKFPLPSTKVDYVLHIDPPASTEVDAATRRLQAATLEKSVNHTSFDPLRTSPICLSIETKKYGGDVKKGDVQMASWQAAQWTCLANQAGDSIEKLPFLPGIIVQGHHWSFVATTRRGDETTLWASTPIGTTMTSLGVLQIMAGLSRLRRWAVEDFWPWYKDNVLKETQMV